MFFKRKSTNEYTVLSHVTTISNAWKAMVVIQLFLRLVFRLWETQWKQKLHSFQKLSILFCSSQYCKNSRITTRTPRLHHSPSVYLELAYLRYLQWDCKNTLFVQRRSNMAFWQPPHSFNIRIYICFTTYCVV